jgi:hypothetical protein
MIKHRIYRGTSIKRNESYQGERIEQKIERIITNKEPIKDGAPLIYTERIKGVQPDYDIRTDRFDVAVEAMDYVTKSHLAKRDARGKKPNENMEIVGGKAAENGDNKGVAGGESTEATK